ncbi:MAG: formylglycine-generating enzyme family protein, partial [Anaerolineae bacterium]
LILATCRLFFSPLNGYSEFIEYEGDRILRELNDDHTNHMRRAEIGDRLWELGDTRFGVGVDEYKIPEIDWCPTPVPAGRVTLEDVDGEFEVQPFYIARYPITYTQFQAFVDAGRDGFMNPAYWEGIEDIMPWDHKSVNQTPANGNRPAEWVSWFQAIAFCRWLSEHLGYEVRLPTEWEWQQAATGGNADYLYPWGPDWDPNRTNSKEAPTGRLVAVGLYPAGASPCGALDMSGNVYEWCMNEFDNPHNVGLTGNAPRTTRGGAWYALGGAVPAEVVRATARLSDEPDSPQRQKARVGFRLVTDVNPFEG